MPEPTSTIGPTLAKVPIFSGLTESELSFIAQRAVSRNYSAGQSVFGEGEPCSGLYVVESGHVRIFKSSPNGREQVLSIDGPGSSIAELPVFDGGNYPASVTAIDEAKLLFVSKQDFQALCLAHPQVALKVLRVVGSRLRRLVGIIEELSFTTVRHRLASFLLRLARKEGRRSAAGVEITLPASNQELASHIGTVRELVSRNLSRLQVEGILQIDGRTVTISNLKALEAGNRFTGIDLNLQAYSPSSDLPDSALSSPTFVPRDKSHRQRARPPLTSEHQARPVRIERGREENAMTMTAERTVRELALEKTTATRVFEKLGIDYCCGGNKSLQEACRTSHLSIDHVIDSLEMAEEAVHAAQKDRTWQSEPLADLVAHIRNTHHKYTREEMARLVPLLDKVCSVHGKNHPELQQVRASFQGLVEELTTHMMKEERVLFPYIVRMEEAVIQKEPILPPPFGSVQNPVSMMEHEHDSAGNAVRTMREASSGYTAPGDACISYQTLYKALADFEADLHQHIHLENNILFPRAVAMEKTY